MLASATRPSTITSDWALTTSFDNGWLLISDSVEKVPGPTILDRSPPRETRARPEAYEVGN